MGAEYYNFVLNKSASERAKMFSEIYSKVVPDYFDADHNFLTAVKEVLESENTSCDFDSELSRSVKCHRCACAISVFQNAVNDSCFAMENFCDSALEYTQLIKTFSCKGRINICCLGSRGLKSVLGVCKVLEEFVKQYGFLDETRTQIQVFILDKNRELISLCERIVAAANEEFTKTKIKLDFYSNDLPEEVKLRVNKSHIVIMVKYLSRLSSSKEVTRIAKNTLINMKKDAVLYYEDYDSVGHYDILKKLIGDRSSFSKIKSMQLLEKQKVCGKSSHADVGSNSEMFPLCWICIKDISPIKFSTWVKNPKIELKSATEIKNDVTQDKSPKRKCRPTRSSNTLRNSSEKFRLVGKFATMDMEKKNKDDSNRHNAKNKAASRHADFDDMEY